MKFGGASLATPQQFDSIAELILKKNSEFSNVIVVVSAMGKTTDDLIQLAKQVNPLPPQREYDMLISVGERVSMALLAMAIAKRNRDAISYTGSQSGIITCNRHTEAKIIDVKPNRILSSLDHNKIVIVAGFQGVSKSGEITTLGRGGSDTTAVALGVSLGAIKVEFYKDVPGIFSEDPKQNPQASLFSNVTYDEALHIVSKGARILHNRSIALAQANQIPLHILSFKEEYKQFGGTIIEPKLPRPMTPLFEEDLPRDELCIFKRQP
jgi:aspartate kinase